jgi:hypothetical protein
MTKFVALIVILAVAIGTPSSGFAQYCATVPSGNWRPQGSGPWCGQGQHHRYDGPPAYYREAVPQTRYYGWKLDESGLHVWPLN